MTARSRLPLALVLLCIAATAIAESFRDRGRHVALLMVSVTRVAMAQREVGRKTK